MLNKPMTIDRSPLLARAQRGVVLIVALIILVAMTLAGIGLVRSVDIANIIAGNLAFRQAATRSGDTGIETAIAWLEANNAGATLQNDIPASGYSATGNSAARSPAAGVSWDTYWSTLSGANRIRYLLVDNNGAPIPDGAGNTVAFVIDRMCALAGASDGASCTSSTAVSSAGGSSMESGEKPFEFSSATYYRITARIAGPRGTVSYVQAMVAM